MKAPYTNSLIAIRYRMERSTVFLQHLLILLFAMLAFNFSVNAQINYSQGWEDGAAGNAGWTISTGGRSTSAPCVGTASMRWDVSDLASGTWTLTSPTVGLSNGLPATLTFNYRRSAATNFQNMTSAWATSASGPWNSVTQNVSNTNCTQYTMTFTPPAGQNVFIRLQMAKGSSLSITTRNYFFDQVVVQQQTPVCPAATFSSVENCGANQFSITANVTVSGTAASLAYTVNGVPATPLAIPSPGSYSIGPFASTSTVTYALSNSHSAFCGVQGTLTGTGYSNCPFTLNCGTVYTFNHCYTNNDERTFSYINPDPSGMVNIKFLAPSPVGSGDGVTFWDGLPNSVQYPLTGVSDLSSHDNILSPGNIFSFSIQSDASGSCADGGVANNWQFEVKCVSENGCTEPQGGVIVTTDCAADNFNLLVGLFSLGNTSNGQPAESADIQYSVDGGPAQLITDVIEGVYDLGNFPLLSSVNVMLMNEDDAVCNNNLGTFTKNALCPPTNDLCDNAQALTIGAPGTCPASGTAGSTLDATSSTSPSCGGAGPIQDVWYSFNTASFGSPISFLLTPGTIGDYGLAIHSSCTGAELACSSGTTLSFTTFNPGTTYYLRVFTNTADGDAGTFSICLTANICAPTFSQNVEPICRVQFAGIDNSSNNTVNGSPALQDFTGTVAAAQVTGGSTYTISVRGNTDGNFTNYFTVFFDWNNDGTFDLPGTQIGSITNNGNCTAAATTNITVPINAVGGISRMRIVKDYATSAVYPAAPCGAYDYGQAEDYLVNVTPCIGTPPAISASSNSPVCVGGQIQLAATSSGTIFSWTGPNSFSSSVEDPLISNATAAAAGTYTVTARSVAGGCPATATTNVSLTQPPGPVNAGGDKTICASAGTVAMTATTPTTGSGIWSQIAGGTATIASPASPTTNMNGLTAAGSPYTFRWTVSNPPCAAAFDDVIVNVDPVPTTANAGADQSVCGNVNATLAANVPAVGTGAWSIVSGPSTSIAQFSSASAPAAIFDPIAANGTYTLRWTISNGVCTASTNDMVLTVMQSPGEPIATTSMEICEDGSVPAGQGLTASCPPLNLNSNTSFPGSNFPSNSTTATLVATVTVPPLPAGAVITNARLRLVNAVANSGSQRSQMRVSLAGAYTLAQTQLSTLNSAGTISPNPVIALPNFPVNGGTIQLFTRETTNDGVLFGVDLIDPDGTIGSAVIEIDYTLPVSIDWYAQPLGGSPVGTAVFDPVAATLVDPSVAGATTFYAGCRTNLCGSLTRLPATFTVNATPVLDAGNYPDVCSVDAPFALSPTPVGGTWSGTGVSGSTFDPASGTQSLTYALTDVHGCSNTANVQIAVEQAVAWYADIDGDGLGDPAMIVMECDQPTGYVSNSNDACPGDALNDADGDGICGDVDSCPTVFGEIGWACDAGPGFILGELNANCACVGIACSQNITVEIRTDNAPAQTTWEIREMNTDLLVCSGGPYTGLNNAALVTTCCLPEGCYDLSVFDSAGDGIASGGYILRMQGSNDRLIDNSGGFTSGSLSSMMGTESFCVPIGTDRLIYTSCDKMDWMGNQYIVASENPAVSAVWIPGAANALQSANTGYEFWFFDPNGSYSFRRFRNHATSDNFGTVGATRACHMLINNWAAAYHIPSGVLMNVRVRSRVNGVNSQWGPACRFKIDAAAAQCPVTKLMDIPGNQFLSCNQYRNFQPNTYVHARPVTGATQYQFRFRQPAEGFEVVRTTTTYFVQLWWTGVPALQTGSQYEVDVRAFKNGQWCPWGDICSLNIGTMPTGSQNASITGTDDSATDVTIWPNPNRGDQLFIALPRIDESTGPVRIELFDMYGKQVRTQQLPVQQGSTTLSIALEDLATGMYMVNILIGGEVHTERLMIQQ